MILNIQKTIELIPGHPKLPDWLFIKRHDTVMTQSIELDENHMKELLLFLERYSADFNVPDLKVVVAAFADITLEYA
jgi:hypothetical protein